MMHRTKIRLGTRASALAAWQAKWVAARLRKLEVDVELVPITTTGDRQQDSIVVLGSPGVFTKEIQQALLDRRIDLAVHSLKDLPTDAVPGLGLAAVPERATMNDVLVSRDGVRLKELPAGARVGTGSQRRRSQLLNFRPDLDVADIRGNVDTRLNKLDQGRYDAIVLAEAGLRRLGLAERIVQVLPVEIILPAVGQGALGLETRSDDESTREVVARLSHGPSYAAVTAERAMLAALHGGCLAPIGGWGRMDGETLVLCGRVLNPDGTEKIEATTSGTPDRAEDLGIALAKTLISQGASEMIRLARDGA